ncbi:uncharacterized protein PSANT_04927 [Moesziomyces antarcticus]|uniref:Uncharacterized protein n=1 Tax=Pseudozyma antarctica TaxID=84753 RepID=A0A5C3FV86_PSEA2|nr:uncharacterized protein PSANT_04927 [Moesziomyces antarcticus]
MSISGSVAQTRRRRPGHCRSEDGAAADDDDATRDDGASNDDYASYDGVNLGFLPRGTAPTIVRMSSRTFKQQCQYRDDGT